MLPYLTGYDPPMGPLAQFRQLRSRTPGHPERRLAPGVETTSGPSGRAAPARSAWRWPSGCWSRNSSGRASRPSTIARPSSPATGASCGGISQEAASLAGTRRLCRLVVICDDNGISIDGEVRHGFTDDTETRFRACPWNMIGPVDGHDVDGIDRAIGDADAAGRPTRIVARTVIGKGAPNQAGSEKAHGEALGVSEVAATRRERGPDLDFAGCRRRGPAPDENRDSMKVSMGLR